MTHVNTTVADASIDPASSSTRLIAGVSVSDTRPGYKTVSTVDLLMNASFEE